MRNTRLTRGFEPTISSFRPRTFGLHAPLFVVLGALAGTSPLTLAADCNENGVDDAADIAAATSLDCDGNGVPDECQIKFNSQAPGGPFFCIAGCDRDCNKSGIPDACELADNDCNANRMPDNCEVRDRLLGVNNALAFEIDRQTGEASPIEPTRFGGHSLEGLAYDPGKDILYGADAFTNELVLVDKATGEGKVIGPLDVPVRGMEFDASTNTLYGIDSYLQVVKIDPRSAETQTIAVLPSITSDTKYAFGLAVQPATGTLFATFTAGGGYRIMALEPTTGESEMISEGASQLDGLAFDVEGNLFGTAASCRAMTRFDTDTGQPVSFSFLDFDAHGLASSPSNGMFFGAGTAAEQLVRIDPVPLAGEFTGAQLSPSIVAIELDPTSGTLYGLDSNPNQLVTINPETGAISAVGPLAFQVSSIASAGSLAFDPARNVLYTATVIDNSWKLVTIDPYTGSHTVVGPTSVVSHNYTNIRSLGVSSCLKEDDAGATSDSHYLDGARASDADDVVS